MAIVPTADCLPTVALKYRNLVLREGSELIRRGGPVTLKKSGFRNMMTPINVSSFFYDPLKLEDQKAVTLP